MTGIVESERKVNLPVRDKTGKVTGKIMTQNIIVKGDNFILMFNNIPDGKFNINDSVDLTKL